LFDHAVQHSEQTRLTPEQKRAPKRTKEGSLRGLSFFQMLRTASQYSAFYITLETAATDTVVENVHIVAKSISERIVSPRQPRLDFAYGPPGIESEPNRRDRSQRIGTTNRRNLTDENIFQQI
jgi:hypothetical protein